MLEKQIYFSFIQCRFSTWRNSLLGKKYFVEFFIVNSIHISQRRRMSLVGKRNYFSFDFIPVIVMDLIRIYFSIRSTSLEQNFFFLF